MTQLPWALLGWVAGVAALVAQESLWSVHFYELFLLLALFCIVFSAIYFLCPGRARAWISGLTWALAFGLLGFASSGWRAVQWQSDQLPAHWQGQSLAVEGVVADLPRATPWGWRLVLELDDGHRQWQGARLPQRLLLSWAAPAGGEAPHAGETWRMTVRLRQPHGLANPGGGDPELWLWEQGIGATGSVRINRREAAPQRLAAAGWGLDALREGVRAGIWAQVPDARVAGVLAALVVGDQAAIERADWDVFRTTGVAHLMSISGLHITLWAWLTSLLVGRVWRWAPRVSATWGTRLLLACPAPVAAAWGGLVLALAYALFSGWGVPAQRTLIMLAVWTALRAGVRSWPWPLVGLTAMALVLARDPWALMQPGFWLSFVAVGVLMSGAVDRLRPAMLGASLAREAPRMRRLVVALRERAWLMWREQWVMTVALAPLSLWLFGQVSWVGLLANALAIPLVTLVITPLGLAGVVWPWAWTAAAAVMQVLLVGLGALAAWPGAAFTWPGLPWPLALGAAVAAVAVVLPMPWTWRMPALVLCLPALAYQPWRPASGDFELVAADVGQGSAVIIRTASGSLLYDAGPAWGPDSDAGQRVLLPLLHHLGDAPGRVVLSHSDIDHVGGAASVLAAWPQVPVWASFDAWRLDDIRQRQLGPHPAGSDLQAVRAPMPIAPGDANATGLARTWTRCQAGQHWEQDGVQFDILHPAPEMYEAPHSTNSMSCVLWVRGAHASALLTGDLDARYEAALVKDRPDVRASLLVAPHHGSRFSSSPVLLDTLHPARVVVQAGYRNRYGHPAPEVQARYDADGIPWVQTPVCGAYRWRSEAPGAFTCQRDVARRHWHWRPQVALPDPDPEPDPTDMPSAGFQQASEASAHAVQRMP
jgi:competence protein ComEC